MAIMIRALKIVDGMPVFPGYFLHKWDLNHKFPFDAGYPENWRKFIILNKIHYNWRWLAIRWIRNHQKPGKKRMFPRKDGLPVAFMVYQWGAMKGVNRKEFYINLFPGTDPETGKTRDLVRFGRLL